jgi:hypothetical protein
MSQRLISRSADLKQLQDEGYDLEVRSGFLLIKHVPYVNAAKEVTYGVLVSKLELADDVTIKPSDHVGYFAGDAPCNSSGEPLAKIINSSSRQVLAEGLEVDHTFSSKPSSGYADYHHKASTYVEMIARHARAINPDATAMTFPVIEDDEEDSVFNYIDTASSRAGISAVTDKLRVSSIAIVGLGGTGSYVLDLVTKTPVKEIHLFDGDRFAQHNAFRSPGAPTGKQLARLPQKVKHFAHQYAGMRRKDSIVVHDYYIDESNVDELREMSFVFLALDRGEPKKLLVEKLEEFGVPFVDVGMGIYEVDGSLAGLLRVTTSVDGARDSAKKHIPFSDGEDNDYSQNIQIADLNALNAALAVIKWKKLLGFYADRGGEQNTVYGLIDNSMINEDVA